MDFLDNIPENFFETAGLIVGIGANIVIGIQVFKEYKSPRASSLSMGYVIGWWLIFVFWFLYGVRFDAMAITISNALAAIIQTVLFAVVTKKKSGVTTD